MWFTRMLPGFEGIGGYKGLEVAQTWIIFLVSRLRRDQIEVYRGMRGIDRVNNLNLFPGHKYQRHEGIAFRSWDNGAWVWVWSIMEIRRASVFYLHTENGEKVLHRW